ncbi:hypothetical protein BCR34DRAFT_491492, partial [Clohesyomyces aquaticus]
STSDPKTWTIIDKWILDCFGKHEICRSARSLSRFIPSRLLHILGDENDRTFLLISALAFPPGARYATISHCWGAKPVDQSLRLLSSTFNQPSQQQLVSELPRTFREAVDVVARFDLQYLWIDRH